MNAAVPPVDIQHRYEELKARGFCIIPGALPVSILQNLAVDLEPVFERTPFCQGDFYGARTKRFGRVLARSAHAVTVVQCRAILTLAHQILDPACDRIQLNLTQAIGIHPGAPEQFPHRDQDMWQGVKGEHEYLLNVIWPLTAFTADNGATRLFPGTHGRQALADTSPPPAEVAICHPGDAICFLGSTLHAAGANTSETERRCLVTGYSLGWLKPYENQWLAYPPAVARNFPAGLAALIGYAQHRPNLGNYEGQCPSVLLGDDVPEYLAAIDALTPDQAEMLAEYGSTPSPVTGRIDPAGRDSDQ